jgi:hypothetical protein
VAKEHQCKLSGIDLEAFNLFKLLTGTYGPASEFEFHTQLSKGEWLKLAFYLQKLRDRHITSQLK